jgi:hypothetical protein
LIAGDDVRACMPLDYRVVLVDVFEDGEFVVQLELPWRHAMAVASDILGCALSVERHEREPAPEPAPRTRLEVVT